MQMPVAHMRLLVLLAIGVTACVRPRDDTALVGLYEATYSVAAETLSLRKDGTFTQIVTLKATAARDTATGTWKYDPRSGYIGLRDGFLLVLDGYGALNADYRHPQRGMVSEPAEWFFGRITLGSSEGIVYHKRSSTPK